MNLIRTPGVDLDVADGSGKFPEDIARLMIVFTDYLQYLSLYCREKNMQATEEELSTYITVRKRMIVRDSRLARDKREVSSLLHLCRDASISSVPNSFRGKVVTPQFAKIEKSLDKKIFNYKM